MQNPTHQVAARSLAQELDYLRDFHNLDGMTHEEIGEKLIERLLSSGFKIK